MRSVSFGIFNVHVLQSPGAHSACEGVQYYADGHSQVDHTFHEGLEAAYMSTQRIFHTLYDRGLEVSGSKSVVVIQLRGKHEISTAHLVWICWLRS